MDERVKGLLKDLGDAINRAVSESPDVDYVMRALKASGYEAWMLLEAKIAVENKHADDPAAPSIQAFFGRDPEDLDDSDEEHPGSAGLDDNLTAEDRRFLKYLKIQY
ncbi:MAG TPA: hypothetical protein VI756_06545 [Blastocatellia bacterium]